jgi:hypothetical protein
MSLRLVMLPALLVLGCAHPATHVADLSGREGWPPNVDVVNPNAGPAGSKLVLGGAYLEDANKVLVNGQAVSFTLNGANLVITLPADLPPGDADVVVVVPGGTSAPVEFKVTR